MTAVAYLVSQYPALSHAFIEREIGELRAAGVQVSILSVRRPDPDELLSEQARADALDTVAIQGLDVPTLLAHHLRYLLAHPRAWLATALRSARQARGPRRRLKRLMYFAEAVPTLAVLRAQGVRHVHVHFANNAADIAELAVELGERVDGPGSWSWSMSMHGPTEFEDPAGYRLGAKVASAAFVACISDFCRRQLLAVAAHVPAAKLAVVRMGVDADRFPPAGAQRAERAGAAGLRPDTDEPLRVLFVGRLVPEKSPLDLVDALARVGRPIEARIVGSGPLRQQIQERIAARGLSGRVHCLGGLGQDQLPVNYRWADVFCLPSHAEGIPVVLMEAMSTELPVLTCDIAGIPELVEDGTNGLLVTPGDIDALADRLRLLADNPAYRSELGARGRETVLREYRSSVNARRLLQLLETVDHGSGGAAGSTTAAGTGKRLGQPATA